MNSKKRFIKIVLIIAFLVILTKISFDREWEYSDEELNARIISDTAPKVVKYKNEYTISIVVENTGGGVWTNRESIKLCIWQDELDWGYRIDLPEDVQIEGGEQYTFVLEGFSVQDKKSTKLEFQMVKEGVTYFGERRAVEIRAVE